MRVQSVDRRWKSSKFKSGGAQNNHYGNKGIAPRIVQLGTNGGELSASRSRRFFSGRQKLQRYSVGRTVNGTHSQSRRFPREPSILGLLEPTHWSSRFRGICHQSTGSTLQYLRGHYCFQNGPPRELIPQKISPAYNLTLSLRPNFLGALATINCSISLLSLPCATVHFPARRNWRTAEEILMKFGMGKLHSI